MSIAVISTGTELLKGTVLNTNLAFLGRELGTLGLSIRLALIAGDREQELYTACAEALGAADTLIISGGLGPTRDDITLDATARFFGLELEPHPELVEKVTAFWHERHRGRVPGQVLRQARSARSRDPAEPERFRVGVPDRHGLRQPPAADLPAAGAAARIRADGACVSAARARPEHGVGGA